MEILLKKGAVCPLLAGCLSGGATLLVERPIYSLGLFLLPYVAGTISSSLS